MLFARTASLSAEQAAEAAGRGELQIIDVREAAELAKGRIAGATHIPLRHLQARLAELDADCRIGFLCHSGSRSRLATRMARKAGLDAVNVRGGMLAWSRAQLPVARGSRRVRA